MLNNNRIVFRTLPDMTRSTNARAVATAVVRTLVDAGHVAYFNGGCVRDELLGLHPEDYDVATDAHPERVRELFRSTNEVGAAFGVMLVHVDRVTIEVATFREEGPYTDRRRPDTVHYSDAEHDARRRDFTINALFLDPLAEATDLERRANITGRIIDLVNGVADLRAGVVRAVGDPDKRLAEDHLRALRAVRFAARLGFSIEDSTASAIREHAAELAGVSRERIGNELRKMLSHSTRLEAARLIELLTLDVPTLGASGSLGQPRPRLGALADDDGFTLALAAWTLDRRYETDGPAPTTWLWVDETVRQLRKTLCLTNDERDSLKAILQGIGRLAAQFLTLAVPDQKRVVMADWFGPALTLLKTTDPAHAEALDARVRELEQIGPGLPSSPILTGEDLIAAGQAEGPALGAALREIEDAYLAGDIASPEEALIMAKKRLHSP